MNRIHKSVTNRCCCCDPSWNQLADTNDNSKNADETTVGHMSIVRTWLVRYLFCRLAQRLRALDRNQ